MLDLRAGECSAGLGERQRRQNIHWRKMCKEPLALRAVWSEPGTGQWRDNGGAINVYTRNVFQTSATITITTPTPLPRYCSPRHSGVPGDQWSGQTLCRVCSETNVWRRDMSWHHQSLRVWCGECGVRCDEVWLGAGHPGSPRHCLGSSSSGLRWHGTNIWTQRLK